MKVTNLKQLLYRSSDIYGSRIAFKLKNDKGEIYPVSYKEFKQDIVQLGTYLIELGFLGKRIAVIGKILINGLFLILPLLLLVLLFLWIRNYMMMMLLIFKYF